MLILSEFAKADRALAAVVVAALEQNALVPAFSHLAEAAITCHALPIFVVHKHPLDDPTAVTAEQELEVYGPKRQLLFYRPPRR